MGQRKHAGFIRRCWCAFVAGACVRTLLVESSQGGLRHGVRALQKLQGFSMSMLMVSIVALSSLARAAAVPNKPSPLLDVPTDLAATAKPIWAPVGDGSEFTMARTEFHSPINKSINAAVVFVTAQLSPLGIPDPRLVHNDYGATIPHGGTSQPKLLCAYKLYVNGVVVGVGPGRRVNQTQGVDVIDVTSVIRRGAPNALGLQGYHQSPKVDTPRMLLQLVLTHDDGTSTVVATGGNWTAMGADKVFNPTGSSGAWAGSSGFPHEFIDMREYPTGWSLPGFTGHWAPAKIQAPFVLPLGAKSALSARPIQVFSRNAKHIRSYTASPPSPPSPHHHPPPPPAPAGPPTTCGIEDEGNTVNIGCATKGGKITKVNFASFGTVTGACGPGAKNNFTKGTCDAHNTVSVLEKACVGEASCEITIGVELFGEPCHRIHKKLAWDVSCDHSTTSDEARGIAISSMAQQKAYLIDFGLELQGGVNLTFTNAKAGQKVRVKLSEELLPNGQIKVPMRTSNDFDDEWTLRDGVQTVMQHEYMEFRYAEISGDLPEPPTLDSARAWVIRYPLSDAVEDQYGDEPMLAVSTLRPPVTMTTFQSSNASLNDVWGLVRYTLVAVSLDVNTDSNTRQRDLCHTDAFITSLGQMALSSDYGVQQMTAEDGFQLDSNIWQGTTDFRSALIGLAYEQALYTGDLRLVTQRWDDMVKHSFVYFFDPSVGLVVKGSGTMGAPTCRCPESWSPAGLPPGIYEALKCSCTDLIDWPSGSRDGYISAGNNASAVANAYIGLAAERMSNIATWLGKTADAKQFASISKTIKLNLREKLFNASSGSFVDGLGIAHSSMHATLFPTMAGAVDEVAEPGMGLAVVKTLRAAGMKCSCMAAYWLLEGLYRIGTHTTEAADLALEILTSTDTNSWLNMIKQGATATMEAWTTDEKGNASWSHPWCSGPNSIIVRLLLGIKPIMPGWSTMSFIPQPSSLEWINATVATGKGSVPATFKQTASVVTATIGVPEGVAAKVCLPAAHGLSAELAAATTLRVDGGVVKTVTEGRMLCAETNLLAGHHELVRM